MVQNQKIQEKPVIEAKGLMRLGLFLGRILPYRLGHWVAASLGRLMGRLRANQRAILESNLRVVLDDPTPRRVRRVAIEIVSHMVRAYYDLISAALRASPEQIFDRIVVDEPGWTRFQEDYGRGQGLILIAAHQSSFDLAALFLVAKKFPVSILVLPVESPVYDVLNQLRVAGGIRSLPLESGTRTLRQALRALRRGGVLILTGDRPVRGQGIEVEFFGRPTVLPDGHVRLALRTGAAIGTVYSRREGEQYHALYRPLELIRTGDEEQDVRENVQQIARLFESDIRTHPEQWHLFLRLWE